jgi:hypothetical protein
MGPGVFVLYQPVATLSGSGSALQLSRGQASAASFSSHSIDADSRIFDQASEYIVTREGHIGLGFRLRLRGHVASRSVGSRFKCQPPPHLGPR